MNLRCSSNYAGLNENHLQNQNIKKHHLMDQIRNRFHAEKLLADQLEPSELEDHIAKCRTGLSEIY